MRLICPNCGAQYEVPDDIIPATGRDVQCSNCGDTWFQKHPDQDADLAEAPDQPLDEGEWSDGDAALTEEQHDDEPPAAEAEPAESTWPDTGDRDAEQAGDLTGELTGELTGDNPPPQTPAEDAPEESAWDDDTPVEEPPAEQAPPPQPRELPEDVREVLREEAEREREARAAAASAGGLETQPDLGLDDTGDDTSQQEREARLRTARMRGMSEKEAMTAAGLSKLSANASRRDLLPDIDEINSTLRKESERQPSNSPDPENDPAPPTESSGFSRGFSFMLLLFAILLAVYVFSGKLAELVPQLEPALESYVNWVNRGRLWLDGQAAALVQWLDTMTSEAAAPTGDGES